MGIDNYFAKLIRSKLRFDGIPKVTLQRHFDLLKEKGYVGAIAEGITEDIDDLFSSSGDKIHSQVQYRRYLDGRLGLIPSRLAARTLVGFIKAIT